MLEEILKAALDRGDVYRTGSGWTRKSLVEIRLPETVVDSILLRVERLTKAQADVLRTASVLGRSFEYPLLRALCGGEVEDELAALAHQQLIEEEPGGHGRHRFRHALTQEAIYGSLATSKRQRIHGEAAMALKGERTAPAVDIAHHLLRANLQDEALPILMRAADSAEGARAYREAAELRQRALEAVEDAGTRAKLTGQVGETLWLAGRAEAAIPYLEEAIDALTGHGSIAEAEHLRLIHGRVQMAHNRHDLAMLDYQRAAEALTTLGPSADLARALMLQGALESISHRAPAAKTGLQSQL